MNEALIRTEDINPENIKNFYVDTDTDREIITSLKERNPTLLVGSRGTGKTMLLRVAERELFETYEKNKTLPVFVNLVTCNLHSSSNLLQVIISRLLISLQNSLKKQGHIVKGNIFKAVAEVDLNPIARRLEEYITETKSSDDIVDGIDDIRIQTDVDYLIDFLNDVCEEFAIDTITFFFDEACQIFQPAQQRIFFDFFRALRSHNLICKAAVYPGIESYGTFQKFHDATIKQISRSINSENYLGKMREIVAKHFPTKYDEMIKQGEALNTIINLASGNPRFLLKSINEIYNDNNKFTTSQINKVVKDFYGSTIWAEHTKLGDLYSGHISMLNWSRNFIEENVLPDIKKINLDPKQKTTIYFAISRDAPEVVKRAIKTLEYSGIILLHTEGTKYRDKMYDRYELNLGVVVLSEEQVTVTVRTPEIVKELSVKLFPDYSGKSAAFKNYTSIVDTSKIDVDTNQILLEIIKKPLSDLDISLALLQRLNAANYNSIEEVLNVNDEKLQEIKYIGVQRSKKIFNLLYNAILEFISG